MASGPISSVQSLSHVQLFANRALQHTGLPSPYPTPRAYLNSCPSSWWCHPPISSSVVPSPPAFSLSKHQGLFNESALRVRWPKYWSFSFSINPSNEYSNWFPLVWSPCSPRDFQESFPAPQFKSIHFLALSLLYGPTLTSIHDYWKNHSFD